MIRPILLFIAGAIIGAFINWAIYSWAMFYDRRISPWMKPVDDELPVTTVERIPIIGWLTRKNKLAAGDQTLQKKHGKQFWLRPFAIEIAWAIGLPMFYFWQTSGGLTGGAMPAGASWDTWFYAHSILIALMCIGTFIDFDEKTIPDQVTITGTLIALSFSAFAPWFRLPDAVTKTLAGTEKFEHITHASPFDLNLTNGLQVGTIGLCTAVLIFAIWIYGLWPKLPVWRPGRFAKMIRFMGAHAIQPKRKTECAIRTRTRTTPFLTIVLGFLFVLGMILIPLGWMNLPDINCQSLYGSIVGMAIGGGFIWVIRIIGTYSMKQEAMGFGDVTLMAMVGAFLGWQAAFLSCVFAFFVALAFVFIQFIITGTNRIAFGPYLCLGTAITLFSWAAVWPGAASGVFSLGAYLFLVLGVSMVLMMLMLWALAWWKGGFQDEEYEEREA